MFFLKATSQFSKLLTFYSLQTKSLDITTVDFHKARMTFNPKSLHLIMTRNLSTLKKNTLIRLVSEIEWIYCICGR